MQGCKAWWPGQVAVAGSWGPSGCVRQGEAGCSVEIEQEGEEDKG